MGWNNRILNINGRGLEMLERAIAIACRADEATRQMPIGSIFDPKCGLIWLWSEVKGASIYLVELTPRQVAEISIAWLATEQAKSMKCEGWDENADHDGHNSRGWRIYCEDWGHVGCAGWSALFAIRPVFLWHGK